MKKTALGIDFGGTAVKIGLVDSSGRVLDERRADTGSLGAPSRWIEAVAGYLAEMAPRGRRLSGIGVGAPGFTDFKKGYIYNLTNVPGWTAVPLAAMMRRRFKLPVFVDNDVNAMALGEYLYGAGRGFRHLFFATLGTGVGGAILVDGTIYRGAYSMAGEVGHMPIMMNGRRTPEGRGGLETYVGNRQIISRAIHALRRGRKSLIQKLAGGDFKRITPKVISEAAAAGDKLALETMDYMADCLATAFAGVTYLLQPEAIIVGGGMAGSGRVLFEPLRLHLAERLNKYFAERIKIIPAVMGNRAGMVGAAALAFQALPTVNREL